MMKRTFFFSAAFNGAASIQKMGKRRVKVIFRYIIIIPYFKKLPTIKLMGRAGIRQQIIKLVNSVRENGGR
jgi:hypothetical protein